MFFHWKARTRDGEVEQAMANHDEAVRLFQERLEQAETAHAKEINNMLQGLVPTHKGGKG